MRWRNILTVTEKLFPHHIITKAPSAELRPNQKTVTVYLNTISSIGSCINMWNSGKARKKLYARGFDAALVARILKLVNTNEYKRNQFCPIIRVSCKAFGVGRRMPIVGKYLS